MKRPAKGATTRDAIGRRPVKDIPILNNNYN